MARDEDILVAATPYGTFQRQTAHLYTHLVIFRYTAARERRMAEDRVTRLKADIAWLGTQLPLCDADGVQRNVQYVEVHGTGERKRIVHEYRIRADYERAKRDLESAEARLTVDFQPGEWTAFRWSHTLKAAIAGAREISKRSRNGAETKIFEVATGKEVA